MNKQLLCFCLFATSIKALPSVTPSQKAPSNLCSKDTLSTQEVAAIQRLAAQKKIKRLSTEATIIKSYDDNKVIIQISGVKTDSLNISHESFSSNLNYIILEDDNEKIAKISIHKMMDDNISFNASLENPKSYSSFSSEDAYGAMAAINKFTFNYSKELQVVTIVIPFKFTPRRKLPITSIKQG